MRADLPNMPEEVIKEWLDPYAELLGWPPPKDKYDLPQGRWQGILSRRPVAFWARVHWRFEKSPLEFENLSDESRGRLVPLGEAIYYGKQNEYSEITDGRDRLVRILTHIRTNGTVPSILVFLEEDSKLSVIDGNHRLVAYFINKDPLHRQTLGQVFPKNMLSVPFNPTLHKWIGSFN